MKLLTLGDALRLREGRKLVFTNGVFDILHAGHVGYLEKAKELGDVLIVALNTDASVRGLGKGDDRPLNPLQDRAIVVGALRCVDGVMSFGEATPERLIATLKPEVHVKGGDYSPDSLPEARIVRSYGGEVVILPTLEGRSTTAILKKLGQS